MSDTGYDDKIQFRAGSEKRAAEVIDEMRLGGLNVSELAREGLREMLRQTLSDEEKIRIHQRYAIGEIDEEVAQILLGDALDEIAAERTAFKKAIELDTDGIFQK